MKNKGKVYPSPSSTPSLLSPDGDALSVIKLLPATILALAVVLSLDDRQVLAYMITRSIKSTNPSSSSVDNNNKNKSLNTHTHTHTHKPPLFDCDCFDCYTHYWFKWDSSPNRELIHQAIEAFEEHLNNGEQSRKKGKKRDRTAHRRLVGKTNSPPPEYDVASVEVKAEEGEEEQDGGSNAAEEAAEAEPPEVVVALRGVAAGHHKGLARKVLPDVIGLLNWRLWSLWSPNV